MSAIHEVAEHIEHAMHGGEQGHGHHALGDGPSLGKHIGLTMAVLGVLLAFCSALVGASRTELIAQMVERSAVESRHQTLSTKACVIEANLVQLRALQPDPRVIEASTKRLRKLARKVSKSQRVLFEIGAMQTRQILTTVTPTTADMAALTRRMRDLQRQADAAHTWARAFEAVVLTHSEAAEHYETAQLCAEVAIVVCSVALLLSSRGLWISALVLAACCVGMLANTHHHTAHALADARVKLEKRQQAYERLSKRMHLQEKALLKSLGGGGH